MSTLYRDPFLTPHFPNWVSMELPLPPPVPEPSPERESSFAALLRSIVQYAMSWYNYFFSEEQSTIPRVEPRDPEILSFKHVRIPTHITLSKASFTEQPPYTKWSLETALRREMYNVDKSEQDELIEYIWAKLRSLAKSCTTETIGYEVTDNSIRFVVEVPIQSARNTNSNWRAQFEAPSECFGKWKMTNFEDEDDDAPFIWVINCNIAKALAWQKEPPPLEDVTDDVVEVVQGKEFQPKQRPADIEVFDFDDP